RSAVSSASVPGMFELPAAISPFDLVMLNNTVHLKPWFLASSRARAGSVSSERYSWSPARKTMCFPLPGPSVPSKTSGAAFAKLVNVSSARTIWVIDRIKWPPLPSYYHAKSGVVYRPDSLLGESPRPDADADAAVLGAMVRPH